MCLNLPTMVSNIIFIAILVKPIFSLFIFGLDEGAESIPAYTSNQLCGLGECTSSLFLFYLLSMSMKCALD